jgi:hypothetical protein
VDDIVPCSKTKHATESQAAHSHNYHDQCSPFCVCACCGTIVEVNALASLPSPVEQIIYSSYILKEKTLSPVSFSIWQPPKF